MYFIMFGSFPNIASCDNLRFWVGFFALDCFVESFVCVWMGMAGYTEDSRLFPIMWVLHLLVALPYVLCTFTIPAAIWSTEGEECRATTGFDSGLFPLVTVYYVHACLFLVYVWMMLSITYFSWAKATFFSKGNGTQLAPPTPTA